MTPSVDSTHRGEWFALLFHVTSVMITFHVTVEIQLKELHEWYIAYLQLRTSVVYLFKTNEPLKWWLLFFFCQTKDFLLKYLMKVVFQEELTVLNLKLWIYENHVCELRSEGRSSQLYTQVLQLRKESLKKKPESFFRLSFPNWNSCVYNWDVLPSCSFEFIACSRESELALAKARSMWPITYH